MEAVIASLLEKSVVAGAFIYILHYVITRQTRTLEAISDTLAKTSTTLIEVCDKMEDISQTIIMMDSRIQKLEERGGV